MRKKSKHVTAEHQGSMKAGSKNRKEEQINCKTKKTINKMKIVSASW